MVGWHHRLNGHEFKQTPVDSEGQGSLVCCIYMVSKNQTRLSDWTTIHTLVSASVFICLYIHVCCMCMCVYVHTHIYTHKHRIYIYLCVYICKTLSSYGPFQFQPKTTRFILGFSLMCFNFLRHWDLCLRSKDLCYLFRYLFQHQHKLFFFLPLPLR